VKYWPSNGRAEDPEVFDAQVRNVCEHYAEARGLRERGVHLVSVDEKTGIQALERLHPDRPMKPGLVERRETEYVRHGTLCLIANLEVATGKVIAPTIGVTRTSEDFAAHVTRAIGTDPEAGWVFVADGLNTHQSEALVKLVARECAIELDLDAKGRIRDMGSMASRRAFLADRSHRIRFVYTPKHCSWLNQVELWFSILVRRLLKRGSFTSTEHLEERIAAFIAYFNRALAKPFKWTYKGRPLRA